MYMSSLSFEYTMSNFRMKAIYIELKDLIIYIYIEPKEVLTTFEKHQG